MKVDLHSTIDGIALRELKRVFKKSECISVAYLQKELKIDVDRAIKLMAELYTQGFLERDERYRDGLLTTLEGKRLAAASVQRISNSKAWHLFDSFMERLEYVNSPRSEFAFRVDRVVLAGSFFEDPGQSDFGDIDLFIRLKARYSDRKKQKDLNLSRILSTTKHFPTAIEQMNWPRTEVVKFLKNRSRYLSITDDYDSHLNLEPKNSFSVIYEGD